MKATDRYQKTNQLSRKPSRVRLRHKMVLAEMAANGGVASKALKKLKYSDEIVHNPQKVTQSRSFQQLLREVIPDSKLILKIDEGLDASKYTPSVAGESIEVPDFAVRHKYVETALKVQGHIKPDTTTSTTFVMVAPEQRKRIAERILSNRALPPQQHSVVNDTVPTPPTMES